MYTQKIVCNFALANRGYQRNAEERRCNVSWRGHRRWGAHPARQRRVAVETKRGGSWSHATRPTFNNIIHLIITATMIQTNNCSLTRCTIAQRQGELLALYVRASKRPNRTQVGASTLNADTLLFCTIFGTELPSHDHEGIEFEWSRLIDKVQARGFVLEPLTNTAIG